LKRLRADLPQGTCRYHFECMKDGECVCAEWRVAAWIMTVSLVEVARRISGVIGAHASERFG
jgi:hypothetical protein